MSTSLSVPNADRSGYTLLASAVLVAGFGLVGYGSYIHLTMGDRTLGHCDGCDPWHPLFVVTPLVAGAALVALAGLLLSRR